MNVAYAKTLASLSTLQLRGIAGRLEEEIQAAEATKLSYANFLQNILSAELAFRVERRFQKNLSAAHFPVEKKLDTLEYTGMKGFGKMDAAGLLDFAWLDNHENLLFFGPPGLGKTHIAIGLGLRAVEKGYIVSFERMISLLRLLKTSEVQRSSSFRINRILKSDLVIIDEIGYSPVEKREANLFFNLISELYEKRSVVITSNKGFDEWAEMMGDEVMTTALLDRLLHHSKTFNLTGESYRIQNLSKEVK
jgi:DNA replication protein DnaC